MKAILEFNLGETEEIRKFEQANDSHYMAMALWDFFNEVLRDYERRGIPENIKDKDGLLLDIRTKFWETLEEYNITKHIL